MAQGLGAFTEGFGAGYSGVQKSRRRRRINKALDYELDELDRKGIEEREALNRSRDDQGLDPLPDYEGKLKPTWGEKLGGWAMQQGKKLAGGVASGVGAAAGAISGRNAPPQPLAVPTDPQFGAPGGAPTVDAPIQPQQGRFGTEFQARPIVAAEGGAVRHMVKKYYAGGKVNTVRPTPLANGGRAIAVNRSLPDRVTGASGNMFADGGNYSSALHRVPQPLANGGSLSPPINVRSTASTAQPLADGGLTDEERELHERRLRRAELEEAQNRGVSGGGAREFAGDVARHTAPRTREEALEMSREVGKYSREAIAPGRTLAQRGRSTGKALYETGRGLVETAGGVAEDLVPWAGGAAEFIGGAAGYGLPEEDGQPAETQPTTEAGPQEEFGPPQPEQGAQPSQAAPPDQAVEQEDPEIDMAGPEMQGVMPEDMPSHSVKDWEGEREQAFRLAIVNGRDPEQAMLGVDKRQQRGFLRYLNQAQRLLVAGDGQSAARSMYAAYSYFPNGTDVRFGITKGANGQPILMGMGKDEETGEPVNDGKTMAITPETLAVMAENASDPSAWRTWTKDWRDMEVKVREYKEVTKPTAQADIELTGAKTDYYAGKNAADIAIATGRGAMKQTDIDRNIKAFEEDRELQKLLGGEEEAVARKLIDAMSRMFIRTGTKNRSAVIDFVMDSYDLGGLDSVYQDMAELGIE